MRVIQSRKLRQSYSGRYPANRDAAQRAAIDKSLSKYLHLVCGHYSTLDTDLFYSCYRPRRGVTYCETCDKWVEVEKPPKQDTTSDTPMF